MVLLGDGLTASEKTRFFVQLDPNLERRMAQLSVDVARSDKLATSLEMGRIFGLRKEFYNYILERQLIKKLTPEALTAAPWK